MDAKQMALKLNSTHLSLNSELGAQWISCFYLVLLWVNIYQRLL
jgi:hypothetical protein